MLTMKLQNLSRTGSGPVTTVSDPDPVYTGNW